MKRILSLTLALSLILSSFAFSVLADDVAQLKTVTVDSAILIPSFSPDVYVYDIIVDDEEAALPEIQYTLNDGDTASKIKEAENLGEATEVKVVSADNSEKTYKFTYRAPYEYDASGEKSVVLNQDTVLNSYSSKQAKTYPQNNASYIDKYLAVVGYANGSDLAVMDFDLTAANINLFAPIHFSIYQTHTMLKQDTNIRIYLADSVPEWSRDTATYKNMITEGALTYDKTKYAEYTYTVAGQQGSHKIDITNLIKDRLLKGEREFTVIVQTVFPENATGTSVTWMAYGLKYGTNVSANAPKIHYYEVKKSSDAALKSLTISNGIVDNTFDPSVSEYNVAVKEGDTPDVSFILSNSHANVELEENNRIGGTTKIKITSQDGLNTKEYKVNFKSYEDFGISETAKIEISDAVISKNGNSAELKANFTNLNVNKKKLTAVTLTKKNGVFVAGSVSATTKEYSTGAYNDELIASVTLPSDMSGVTVEAYIYDTTDENNKKAIYEKVVYPSDSAYTPAVINTDKAVELKADADKPGNVIIFGKGTPNEYVMFFVAKTGKTLSQFTLAELNENAVAIDMVKANAQGLWTKSVTFPDVAGYYVAYLDAATTSDSFLHASFAQKKSEIEEVYSEIYSDSDKATVITNIKAQLGMKDEENITDLILGIDTSCYNTLKEEDVIGILYNITKEEYSSMPTVSDDDDVTIFVELYNKAVIISKLNKGIAVPVSELISTFAFSDASVLTSLLSKLNSAYHQVVSDTVVNGTVSGAKLSNTSDLDDRIRRSIIFTLINYPENVSIAQDYVDTYGAYLELKMTNYNAVNDKAKVISNLSNAGPFKNLTAMSNELDRLSVMFKNAQIVKPQGGGGGGGSSSSQVITPAQGTGTGGQGAHYTDEFKPESGKYFGDVESDHWAYEPTKFLNEKGILKGMDNGNFEPSRSIKREEFAKILVLAFGLKTKGEDKAFADVSENEWYYEYVKIASENGIINGIGEGVFGAGSELSRQDIAVMLARVLDKTETSDEAFADDNEISDYAKDAVYTLKSLGILNGTGNGSFEPKRAVTRAECAKIVYELIKE